jgi:hypothetical protein
LPTDDSSILVWTADPWLLERISGYASAYSFDPPRVRIFTEQEEFLRFFDEHGERGVIVAMAVDCVASHDPTPILEYVRASGYEGNVIALVAMNRSQRQTLPYEHGCETTFERMFAHALVVNYRPVDEI